MPFFLKRSVVASPSPSMLWKCVIGTRVMSCLSRELSNKSSSGTIGSFLKPSSWRMKSCGVLTNLTLTSSSEMVSLGGGQTRGLATKKHKAVLRLAKGYRGRANRTFKAAIRRVEKAMQYAYRDRKTKKRNFRKLWIIRINAGVRQLGLSYSNFIHYCQPPPTQDNNNDDDDEPPPPQTNDKHKNKETNKKKHPSKNNEDRGIVALDRKVLADLASNEPFSFKSVVDVVKMLHAKNTTAPKDQKIMTQTTTTKTQSCI